MKKSSHEIVQRTCGRGNDGEAQSYELKHLADLNITEIDFGQGGNTGYKGVGSVTMNGQSRQMKSEVLEADATGYATSMLGNSLFVEREGLSGDGSAATLKVVIASHNINGLIAGKRRAANDAVFEDRRVA
jgi:hypothetical protein